MSFRVTGRTVSGFTEVQLQCMCVGMVIRSDLSSSYSHHVFIKTDHIQLKSNVEAVRFRAVIVAVSQTAYDTEVQPTSHPETPLERCEFSLLVAVAYPRQIMRLLVSLTSANEFITYNQTFGRSQVG
jgi:hypothetical protein